MGGVFLLLKVGGRGVLCGIFVFDFVFCFFVRFFSRGLVCGGFEGRNGKGRKRVKSEE